SPSAVVVSSEPAAAERDALSLHDALPISRRRGRGARWFLARRCEARQTGAERDRGAAADSGARTVARDRRRVERSSGFGGKGRPDRKSTRLNSSHVKISYAVFCLKKKKIT